MFLQPSQSSELCAYGCLCCCPNIYLFNAILLQIFLQIKIKLIGQKARGLIGAPGLIDRRTGDLGVHPGCVFKSQR